MSLSDKYDKFYGSEIKKEIFSEITVGRWPKNRMAFNYEWWSAMGFSKTQIII